MTEGDALTELGLQGAPTPAEIRAAYLRLLKQRKPDQDAEGFKRLREAYELVKDGVTAREAPPPREESPPAVEQARAWLAAELKDIGPAPVRVLERVRAIDYVASQFPRDAKLTMQLAEELHRADLGDDARDVIKNYMERFGGDRESEPFWLWLLTENPSLLSGYQLETAPGWLGTDRLLEVCLELISKRADHERAGQLLKRVINNTPSGELFIHVHLVVRAILELAVAKQSELAADLARRLRIAVQTDETQALGQWADLRATLPLDAEFQLARALLFRQSRRADITWDLAPHVRWAMFRSLGECPQLLKALEGVLPERPPDPEYKKPEPPPLTSSERDDAAINLKLCAEFLDEKRDVAGAAESLSRVINDSTPEGLRMHESLARHLILQLAVSGFLPLAQTLAMRLHQSVASDETKILAEWASMRDHLPEAAVLKLAMGLHRPNNVLVWDLGWNVDVQVRTALERHAPRLTEQLGHKLPSSARPAPAPAPPPAPAPAPPSESGKPRPAWIREGDWREEYRQKKSDRDWKVYGIAIAIFVALMWLLGASH